MTDIARWTENVKRSPSLLIHNPFKGRITNWTWFMKLIGENEKSNDDVVSNPLKGLSKLLPMAPDIIESQQPHNMRQNFMKRFWMPFSFCPFYREKGISLYNYYSFQAVKIFHQLIGVSRDLQSNSELCVQFKERRINRPQQNVLFLSLSLFTFYSSK